MLFFIASRQVSSVTVENMTIDRLWEYKTLAPVFATPAIADINNDGLNEVIVNSMDGKMYVLDGTSGKRHFFFETEDPLLSSPVIRENKNKEKWIILAGQDKSIYAISGSGKCQWSTIRQDMETSVISTPVFASLSGADSLDVVLAGSDGKVYALNGDRGWRLWKSQETAGRFFSTPLVVNINEDTVPDIIVGSPNKRIYGLDGKTGLKLWETKVEGPVNSSAIIFDSGSSIVCDETGIIYKLKTETGLIIEKMDLNASIISTPAIINRQVAPVLIVPLKNGTVKAVAAGTFKMLWEYDTKYQDPIVSSPAIYDMNSDGCDDVVLTSRNGYLYVLDGKDGKDLVAPHFAENSVSSSPVLADINGDGYLDIVFGSENGNVIALTLKTVPDRLVKKNRIVHGTFLNRGHEKI